METRMKKLLLVMAIVVGLLVPNLAMAQIANPTNTTVNGAISSASVNQVTLTSGTGVSAASGSVVNTYLIIDDEVMAVQSAVVGTTVWRVTRGVRGTSSTTHATGAIVRSEEHTSELQSQSN